MDIEAHDLRPAIYTTTTRGNSSLKTLEKRNNYFVIK